MIHTHSLGRAARYYPQQTALVSEGKRLTFREAHDRVENIAAALSRHGFQKGDRLAILLPNEPELGDGSGNAELLHLGNVSPVGSKGTTLGRNRSLLVVQNSPPGF